MGKVGSRLGLAMLLAAAGAHTPVFGYGMPREHRPTVPPVGPAPSDKAAKRAQKLARRQAAWDKARGVEVDDG